MYPSLGLFILHASRAKQYPGCTSSSRLYTFEAGSCSPDGSVDSCLIQCPCAHLSYNSTKWEHGESVIPIITAAVLPLVLNNVSDELTYIYAETAIPVCGIYWQSNMARVTPSVYHAKSVLGLWLTAQASILPCAICTPFSAPNSCCLQLGFVKALSGCKD
jgi:hypothetical protein